MVGSVGSVVLASTQRGSWCPRASHRGVHWPPERITIIQVIQVMDDHFSCCWNLVLGILQIPHFRKPPCVVEWTWTRMRETSGETTGLRTDHRNHKTLTKCLERRKFSLRHLCQMHQNHSQPTSASANLANLVRPEGSTLKMWMVSLGTDPIPWIQLDPVDPGSFGCFGFEMPREDTLGQNPGYSDL